MLTFYLDPIVARIGGEGQFLFMAEAALVGRESGEALCRSCGFLEDEESRGRTRGRTWGSTLTEENEVGE
jgi:hypothetical protein